MATLTKSRKSEPTTKAESLKQDYAALIAKHVESGGDFEDELDAARMAIGRDIDRHNELVAIAKRRFKAEREHLKSREIKQTQVIPGREKCDAIIAERQEILERHVAEIKAHGDAFEAAQHELRQHESAVDQLERSSRKTLEETANPGITKRINGLLRDLRHWNNKKVMVRSQPDSQAMKNCEHNVKVITDRISELREQRDRWFSIEI